MILLDTHVLIWLTEGSERLGTKTLVQIDQALADSQLAVSAISFWEIAMLIEKGRLEFNLELGIWRQGLLQDGLQEIPMTGSIAIRAGQLPEFHGDPADRIIVSTAIEGNTVLVTAEKKILEWGHLQRMVDAAL